MDDQPDTRPPRARLDRLAAHAGATPDAVALRHKKHGRWHAWRWRDARAEVERLAEGLARRGFGPGSRLALMGELGPHLVLATLAARLLDGGVAAVPRAAGEAELARVLDDGTVRHVLTQGRATLGAWLRLAARAAPGLVVVYDHVTPDGHAPRPEVITYHALRAQGPAVPRLPDDPAASRGAGSRSFLWAEEDTAWPSGPDTLTDRWLEEGAVLAFPESVAAAGRDRCEITPDALLLSTQGLSELARSVEARLPVPGGWSRRLVDGTLDRFAGGRPGMLDRLLLRRVLGPLGLARCTRVLAHDADGSLVQAEGQDRAVLRLLPGGGDPHGGSEIGATVPALPRRAAA